MTVPSPIALVEKSVSRITAYMKSSVTRTELFAFWKKMEAKASKPFMKLSGPLAVPPPLRPSVEPRRGERLVPVPLPHLKSMPSVLARVRMESSESFTELMKQAEHCGVLYPVTPNSTWLVVKFQCQLRPSAFGSMRTHPTLNH